MAPENSHRHSPAASRNRGPILDVLRTGLPGAGLVLEVASGTGEHVVHFARALPQLTWQPTDPSPDARQSIAAWITAEDVGNVHPPLALDAAADEWPVGHADAIICINMLHISPWAATEGLLRGASRILDRGAPLYLYGPFKRSDHALEPSNEAFDRELRRRDPRWGLRDLDEVTACARSHGLALERVVEMPAHNLSVLFRRI